MDKWRFEYEEQAGYDCMSSAYVVKAGDRFVCAVDVRDFARGGSWEDQNSENDEAREMARLIVDSVNSRIS